MSSMRLAATAIAILAAPAAMAEEAGDPARGLELAEALCAECHAVRVEQFLIPHADATHFADTASEPGMSPRALTVWLQTSHPSMPNIVLTPQQTDDIVAYIMSLKGL